ncbi:MAG TPA: hypothetical protein DCS05_04375 [Nitrospiraceae bacterium]|nr:hypothetical protein [Nitrospiraceae bacterium]
MDNSTDLCKGSDYADRYDGNTPFSEALVMGRFVNEDMDRFANPAEVGGVVTNVHHLVTHHSPTGFEFGYAGSGPADLALNVCQTYLNIQLYSGEKVKCFDGWCWKLAWGLHQEFKRDIIASVPRSGVSIPFETIDAWFQEHITDDLRQACAVYVDEDVQA